MHGVLGFDGAPRPELARRARAELQAYDVTLADGRVSALRPPGGGDDRWLATLADGRTARPAAVILATGVRLELPPLPGLAGLWGTRAAMCPFCHGWEVRGRPLLAIADTPEMLEHYAPVIAGWSPAVHPVVVTDGDRIEPSADGGVVLHRAGGERVAAAFAFVGATPRSLLDDLLPAGTETTEAGLPVADRWGIVDGARGLLAAGMAIDLASNVTLSIASGSRAALATTAWLARREGRAVHLPAA
jgi:alkyl hydroperoxide reductase subunit AhpF